MGGMGCKGNKRKKKKSLQTNFLRKKKKRKKKRQGEGGKEMITLQAKGTGLSGRQNRSETSATTYLFLICRLFLYIFLARNWVFMMCLQT